jgi:O-antigen/teichoic acid export membrane protein
LGAPWIVYWLLPGLRITPAIVLAISVAVTLIAIQQITAEALRGMHESRWANLLTGGQISGPITALLLVALVLPLSGIHDVTLGEVLWLTDAALAFTVCMALYFAWRVARARLAGLGRCAAGRAVTYGEVLALCVPLMVANVLIFATSQADVWIAGACFDSDSVALYGVARRVATAVGMLAQITEMSVVASLVTLHAQGRLEEMEQLLRTAATLASLPSLAVLGLILVAGAPLLEFCFGSFYRGAAPVLTVLAVGQVFITWCGACGCVLAFAGRQNVFLLTNLVATIALFAIGLPVGRYFGMLGISWTVTAVTVLQWTAVAWLAHRLVGVRTDATLRAVGSLWRLVRTVEALR